MSGAETSKPALKLVLASGSPYRRKLFERFGLPFTVAVSNVDEEPLPGESPVDLVRRLAHEPFGWRPTTHGAAGTAASGR